MPTLIALLGMHRSGTSATAGTLQELGVELGPASESDQFNQRGNREITKLRKLHERILRKSGGSWWDPPAEIAITDNQRRKRDEIVAGIQGETIGVKDPRMLLLLDFWRELEPLCMGVIRNPVAVRDSLERRAREWGSPDLPPERWEALWRHYNGILLAEHERAPFPLIDFERRAELEPQARAALEQLGIHVSGSPEGGASFFDPELVSEGDGADWRSRALSPDSIELWDRLVARTVAAD